MKIKMKQDHVAKADEIGSSTMVYKKDQEYTFETDWQMKMASKWINSGKAEKSGSKIEKTIVKPAETKVKKILKKVMGKKK
jgi:hypothetical protein